MRKKNHEMMTKIEKIPNRRVRVPRERVWESSTQLQIQKKQLHSNFFPPNTPNSSSSTVNLLQKKGGADPQLHGFHVVPQEVLHQIQFRGVGVNYPPLPLVSGK
jgi:hypothetical protein